MSEPGTYLTLARETRAELIIERSRFLAVVAPAATEAEAREVVATERAAHPRARHHCLAMVIGPEGALQRSSDDGEPSGTAGAPMLEALLSAGVSDVVAVVVRYFGGVLLGTGGLTRAYRGAVAAALEEGTTAQRTRVERFTLTLDYSRAAALEGEARGRGWQVDADYGAQVELTLAVPAGHGQDLRSLTARLTEGAATPSFAGEGWMTLGSQGHRRG
ncbi:IMPACT family protein [Serinibacter salmoneus]|uniref:Putative YigZ family protein n=1 Tax=Serinibacter salmoneus TaxID=556530 RepID=A0A2A9D0H0_9MICO|nr:YigZ family protein [Serinibacter salmoneus]PFG20187.1 putative YigZ family protein [Serinibacter salmoneus]